MKRKPFAFFLAVLIGSFLLALMSFLDSVKEQPRFHESPFFTALFIFTTTTCGLLLDKRLNYIFKRIPGFGKIFSEEEKKEKQFQLSELIELKKSMLSFTQKQYQNSRTSIIGPEMIGGTFPAEISFCEGAIKQKDSEAWKKCHDAQLVFITGEKGSGKSFELINRVEFFCQQLEAIISKPELIATIQVPVYVELRSLNRVLDYDWIAEYISKSAKLIEESHGKEDINENKKDNKKWYDKENIEWLLEKNQVVYFLDGADEMISTVQGKSVSVITDLSKRTSVITTCRKDLYDELKEKDIITKKNEPAECTIKPLSKDWIYTIISCLKDVTDEKQQEIIAFIDKKEKLLEHLSRPIILNLFLLAFFHLTEEEKKILQEADIEQTYKLLWERYEQAITKRKVEPTNDILQMRTYTVWLAKIMGEKSFFIESIQPDWLKQPDGVKDVRDAVAIQKCYYILTRIIAAVCIGFALGCIIATPLALIPGSIIGGLIITTAAGFYKLKIKNKFRKKIVARIFRWLLTLLLSLLCGVYQGFSVPRQGVAQTYRFFSIAEMWPGILLGITLGAIFSYRIVLEKERDQYILPIEIFHFDWPHAIKYGFTWGFFSAIIVGSTAAIVNVTNNNILFMNNWLKPQIRNIGKSLNFKSLTGRQVDIGVFAYGFFATFIVASIIIVVLAGRYSDRKEEDVDAKQKLNYAIKKSFWHALSHSAKVLIISAVLYVAIAWKFEMIDIVHCITFPLGMFLMAFLWFGGMEGVNHILLRAGLYLHGIAPANYTPWVKANEDMGLILPTGFQMKFYHPTLAEYYKKYSWENDYDVPSVRLSRSRIDSKIYIVIFALMAFGAAYPFIFRYRANGFWKNRNDIHYRYSKAEIQPFSGDSIYSIQKPGRLVMAASGFINVGTFVGWVWPEGTTHGFMGMPLGQSYNISDYGLSHYRHAALLFRLSENGTSWGPFQYVTSNTSHTTSVMIVHKGQLIQFIVNDKEWENNKGNYNLTMNIENPENGKKSEKRTEN